ncbi:MAG: DEAD/DEAH box helicase [Saccharospirillaceae bacterium]|nr:DEAD/DEAH box helicase [Saccharospirillaceae bacterium]
MTIKIPKQAIKQSFNSNAQRRGEHYFKSGQVISISFDDNDDSIVNGEVRGNYENVYYISVSLDEDGGLETDCSCPVAFQCKHGVAIALKAFEVGLFVEHKKTNNRKSKMQSWFDNAELKNMTVKTDNTQVTNQEFLNYYVSQDYSGVFVNVRKTKFNKKGGINKGAAVNLRTIYEDVSYGYQQNLLSQKDNAVFKAMSFSWSDSASDYRIDDAASAQVLIKMIETDRCYWMDPSGGKFEFLSNYESFEFNWTKKAPFKLEILIKGSADFIILPTSPLCFLNLQTQQMGQLESALSEDVIDHLHDLPALNKKDAQQFSQWLFDNNLPVTAPIDLNIVEITGEFQPVLNVFFDEKENMYYAKFYLQYGEFLIEYNQYEAKTPTQFNKNGVLHRWVRDLNAEKKAYQQLKNSGLNDPINSIVSGKGSVFTAVAPYYWVEFKLNVQADLELNGWKVILENIKLPSIHEINHADGFLEGEFLDGDESGYDNWFELGLSVNINGKKIDLVPLLIDGLAHIADWENLPDKILVPNNGDFLKFNKKDIQPIIKILSQLANKDGQIGRYHADALNHIPFVNTWSGGKKIQSLAKKLGNFKGIKTIKSPRGLNAELRDYQQQGLNWLGFLQEYGFGGILADDMGLGKTVQALAMMQVLFNRKKIDKPIMVVCPTSLVGNWRSEAKKFAPKLKVLVLHGPQRHELFDSISEYHLIITTYPLIHRDIELHKQQKWLWLILDEAQVIKNPKAKMTQAIKQLKAKHRLCMTGTPIENHLGELWSLYDFLMPGFLNSFKGFNDLYRKPIEDGDMYAQNWLNERIKPFLLRRTKDAVATELPAKTEIIQHLEMPTDQRKLYESIRVTMEKRVRQLLKEKGIAKSHIEFLDALLKLRQACCHPKLVKLDEAKKVKNSAKLQFILDVLPEMLEEGRKVLIFSQFAQMLLIIEDELHKHKITTAKLTGQTRKREEEIAKFTSGEVGVFLISLKAGGVGLNLTQADTVIHFDPWWNPAAENQATDRAYRIGQDKPVFVYKLVTQDSIEERVLELQKKKQAMADAVYEGKADAKFNKMDSNQLLGLFGIE